jgi:hypothetical protein
MAVIFSADWLGTKRQDIFAKALEGKFPKVKLDKEVHDFGTINEGDMVETEFLVTNDGEVDLIISDAKGSCGCTVPEPPKEPIKPGASAPIKVTFNSQFLITIILLYN